MNTQLTNACLWVCSNGEDVHAHASLGVVTLFGHTSLLVFLPLCFTLSVLFLVFFRMVVALIPLQAKHFLMERMGIPYAAHLVRGVCRMPVQPTLRTVALLTDQPASLSDPCFV